MPGVPPLPPSDLRRLVCYEDSLFALPENGSLVYPDLSDAHLYRSVLDFGCGCGRVARQLLMQTPRPDRYLGLDIHRGMIEWCRTNLTPFAPAFQFQHHDVWNLGLGNDNTRQSTSPFPAGTDDVSLVIAHSVFTHLYKEQVEFYLDEIARVLTPDGVARTTWFLFDRLTFPMMFDFQVALFINETDPSNAVIYDWRWLLNTLRARNLRVLRTVAPTIRGHQWELYLGKATGDLPDEFPRDDTAFQKLCGSGVEAQPTVQSPAPLDSVALPSHPSGPRHRLRFTGDIDREGFTASVGELSWWYHSYYFDNGFSVRGDYDIGADIAGYGFPESMKGLKVLDVGTGGGWFAHYFEQLGAEVVTVDARGYCDFDVYGRSSPPGAESPDRDPDRLDEEGVPVYFSPVSRAFWIMKDLLGSRTRYKNARVYDLRPELFGGETFDLVFLGAILCHLRDPIGALMAARSVCRHRVIASTPVVLGESELSTLPRQYLPYTAADRISWWLPNEACFKHWFLAAGFSQVDVSRSVQLRADLVRRDSGSVGNGDQILRVGSALIS